MHGAITDSNMCLPATYTPRPTSESCRIVGLHPSPPQFVIRTIFCTHAPMHPCASTLLQAISQGQGMRQRRISAAAQAHPPIHSCSLGQAQAMPNRGETCTIPPCYWYLSNKNVLPTTHQPLSKIVSRASRPFQHAILIASFDVLKAMADHINQEFSTSHIFLFHFF